LKCHIPADLLGTETGWRLLSHDRIASTHHGEEQGVKIATR